MREIWFHDLYETKQKEYLTTLLTKKYGYVDSNPGPVVAYPPNMNLFPTGIPEQLPAGTQLAIPWTQERLAKQIQLDQTSLRERKEAAMRAVRALNTNFNEMNKLEQKVDVIAEVLLLMFGIGKMAALSKKAMVGTAKEAETIARGMAQSGMLSGYEGIKVTLGLDPTTYTGKGATWQNLLRHALSLTSPSYWASAIASAWTGDWDLWKYGSEGVKDQAVARVLRKFAKEASEIALKIAAMERQKAMRFYQYRVTQTEPVHAIPTCF